jgi:hypothetical protein
MTPAAAKYRIVMMEPIDNTEHRAMTKVIKRTLNL